MNYFFNQEVPYLSIIEIYKRGDRLKGISLYLCQEKYEYWKKLFNDDCWEVQEWDILSDAKLPTDKNFTEFVFKTKFLKNIFLMNEKTFLKKRLIIGMIFTFIKKTLMFFMENRIN